MKPLPNGWHIYQRKPGRDPERELRRLRDRFGDISRRFYWSAIRRRVWRKAQTAAFYLGVAVIGMAVPYIAIKALSPWPADRTLRHIAAAPNCDAARSIGLAPAFRGQPGYYPSHDADNDGIACEVWPRR